MTNHEILSLVFGLLGILFGLIASVKTWRKHKKIDTESIAVVNDVQDLGRSDGRKVYAIRYDVKSSEPFELLVTPCKKAFKIGKERVVYYEKGNPNQNYYFKSIGQFDNRLITPIFLLFASIAVVVTTMFV